MSPRSSLALLSSLLVLISLSGCSSEPQSAGGASVDGVSAQQASADAAVVDSGVVGGTDPAVAEAGGSLTESSTIAVSAYASVTTSDPTESAARFSQTVGELGGRVDYDSTYNYEGQPSATISGVVPADRLQEALDSLDGLGEVSSTSTDRTDVGQQLVDTNARAAVLEESIDRLQDLMDQATSVDELIAAETALTERQAELNSLRDQLEWLNNQVEMSQITADFSTADQSGDGFSFGRAWQLFLQSLRVVAYALLVAAPWAALAGLIVFGVLAVRRRRATRSGATPEDDLEPRD